MNHESPIHIFLVVQMLFFAMPCAAAEPGPLNGNWVLDAESSDNFDDAGKRANEEAARIQREKKDQKFARDEQKPLSGSRFARQAMSTDMMIREDARSEVWDPPDLVRIMVDAEVVKLYSARKLAILYDAEVRRLLQLNEGGRYYSVSGRELTSDDIGRALAYADDGAIVVETDLIAGGKLIERFELDEATDRLMVTFKLQQRGTGPWVEFVRFFTRDG
jgi:hypothetical protein